MHKLGVLSLLVLGLAGSALATATPEIDPGTGMNALALLAGAIMVIRSRKK